MDGLASVTVTLAALSFRTYVRLAFARSMYVGAASVTFSPPQLEGIFLSVEPQLKNRYCVILGLVSARDGGSQPED